MISHPARLPCHHGRREPRGQAAALDTESE